MGVLVGALIGWFAGLAVARRTRDYAIELREQDRAERDSDLRKALAAEMAGNIELLKRVREKGHHGLLERSAWTAAAGIRFKHEQSRQFLVAAYATGAQYDTAVHQIPPAGSGNPSFAAIGLANELAIAALAAFEEASRLYFANNEDPAHPPRRPQTGEKKTGRT